MNTKSGDSPISIVLAQPTPFRLPEYASALLHEPQVFCRAVTDTPEGIARKALALAPKVLVYYCPVLNEATKSALMTLMEQSDLSLLLVSESGLFYPELKGNDRAALFIPQRGESQRAHTEALLQSIQALSRRSPRQKERPRPAIKPFSPSAPVKGGISPQALQNRLIAIGASTGGPEALSSFFHALPPDMPGMVVVQHMPPVFTKMYADRLDTELPFSVTEAQDRALITPGSIHIAPGGRHLLIEKRGNSYYTRLGGSEKHGGHCPAVDVLFESVASVVGKNAVGIIMTGMGADGALGLLKMRRAGAYTIGQDEESSVVYGMPKKALDYGGVIRQAPLLEISNVLLAHLLREEPV